MSDALSALVRRVDEDRWLAARFAPRAVRERLIAIYAVNYEIAKTAESVREPQIGAIRLAWWRDAIGEIAEGKAVRAHPAAEALARALPLPLGLFQPMIEARHCDLETTPFETWEAAERYVDATAGNVLRLALAACNAPAPDDFVRAAGHAWGFTGLLRAQEHLAGRGRAPFPAGVGSDAREQLAERARAAYAEARATARQMKPDAFPAYGYLAFVPANLKSGELLLPTRQVTLLKASVTGRI